eukprot:6183323-Pleurochrysis_carterae.AAC.2
MRRPKLEWYGHAKLLESVRAAELPVIETTSPHRNLVHILASHKLPPNGYELFAPRLQRTSAQSSARCDPSWDRFGRGGRQFLTCQVLAEALRPMRKLPLRMHRPPRVQAALVPLFGGTYWARCRRRRRWRSHSKSRKQPAEHLLCVHSLRSPSPTNVVVCCKLG